MTAFLAPMLAIAVGYQAPANRAISGEVVDDRGKPVAKASVVFYSPPTLYGKGESVELQTTSDSSSKFSLSVPPLKRVRINGVQILAYHDDYAITAHAYMQPPFRLVLAKPAPRTIVIEGPDGKPVAGARVALRVVHVFGGTIAEVPASLADRLAKSTGPDGKATITCMAPRDQVAAVRVTAEAIGTQDILLIERPGRDSEGSVIVIKLKPTSHLAGRIVDAAGKPVANQPVEVWTGQNGAWLPPNRVELKGGQLRSAADGAFKTPDNLMVGATYRVAIQPPGKEPVFSDWTTIGAKPLNLPLIVLRTLRAVGGRVVDRQGKPVAGIEVFQAGDGPESTTTRTDAEGHFSLGGFRQGPVFVFAHGDGFRFEGRLVNAPQREVTLTVTRENERPAREMRMLADPIARDEALALARRLVEPLWKKGPDSGPDRARHDALCALAAVDAGRAWERLQSVKFTSQGSKNRAQRELALALADTDIEEATAAAESIAAAGARSWALIRLADRVQAGQRERKRALLGRALLPARITEDQSERLRLWGDIAERWYELGEMDKAKDLFAEGLELARKMTDKTDIGRGWFAGRLARVDLPAALAIAKDFDGDQSQGRVLGGIVLRLVDQSPAEAARVWTMTKGMGRLIPMDPTLTWKLATVDPARARRVLEALGSRQSRPELDLFLALGLKSRDESASRQAFQTALQGMDRLLRAQPERYQILAGALLPIVERIDPALVPEIFWRDLASRIPAATSRAIRVDAPVQLIMRLAFYDRDVAAALFEPSRERMEKPSEPTDRDWSLRYVAWSLFDPRAAVARLERIPFDPGVPGPVVEARLAVAQSLAKSRDERFRERGLWNHWDIIFGGLDRDF